MGSAHTNSDLRTHRHAVTQTRRFRKLLTAKTSHDGPVGPEARRDQVLAGNNLRNPTAWAPPRSSTPRVDGACYSAAGRSTGEDAACRRRGPGVLATRWGYLRGPVGCLAQPLGRLRRRALPGSFGAPPAVHWVGCRCWPITTAVRRGTWPNVGPEVRPPAPPPPTATAAVPRGGGGALTELRLAAAVAQATANVSAVVAGVTWGRQRPRKGVT